MITSVVAHEIDDWGSCPSRVVQISDAIAQARTQVHQCRRGPAGHAAEAIGGSCANALK